MARTQVADGRTASNVEGSCKFILNKQLRTADKCGPPAWWLGEVLKTPHCKNVPCCETVKEEASLGSGLILWCNQERDRWRVLVNAVMNFRVP